MASSPHRILSLKQAVNFNGFHSAKEKMRGDKFHSVCCKDEKEKTLMRLRKNLAVIFEDFFFLNLFFSKVMLFVFKNLGSLNKLT